VTHAGSIPNDTGENATLAERRVMCVLWEHGKLDTSGVLAGLANKQM
jgi:predicted transcriptional regulator